MSARGSGDPPRPAEAGEGFATTRWSIVLAAAGGPTAGSRQALETLCGAYWYPLYAYLRRRGHDLHEAQDLTQGFFARFLEKNYLEAVRPERGRFRAYLLGALHHYLANERDHARAVKRGGGRVPLSLDLETAEGRYRLEPAHELTPERVFERRWALTLLETALGKLEAELVREGKGGLIEPLRPFLAGDQPATSHAAAAAALDMSEGAVKTAVHRLRRRFRDLLREEIAQTVAGPGEIDEEIHFLFEALGSRVP